VSVPASEFDNLWHGIAHQWPAYLAYATSFLTIGGIWMAHHGIFRRLAFVTSFATILIMWVSHHHLFTFVRRADARFLYANGLLLFVVTVVPFPTALVAEYFEKPGASTAAAVYGGTFVLCSIAYNILWRTAIGRQRRLLRADVSEANIRELTRRYLWGLPLYALATAAAFVSVQATFAICLGLWVFWVVAARNT